jgi:hypothetical protein
VRAAYRNHNDPTNHNDNLGFRCARAHEQTGRSPPEQAAIGGVAVCAGVRRNRKTAGMLVVASDDVANARRPVARGFRAAAS